MKKILVTGAAGFIGSHLSESLLKDGWEVIGIDNFDPFYNKSSKQNNLRIAKQSPRFRFIEDNIQNILQHDIQGLDAVVHLAAKAGVRPSIDDPMGYIDANIHGTQAILELMRIKKVKKLIFASSSSVYGNNKKIPFSENDNVDFPISPYASSKKSCELLIHTYHHLYNIDCLCLRFFTVYGPRQRPDLAIHKFFNLLSTGRQITMYGDGSSSRDYTFISDTIAGIRSSIDYVCSSNDLYEILNLGNNKPVNLKSLIDEIYKITNSDTPINQIEMQPGDVDITFADISKAQKMLNYKPQVEISEGLRLFYDWFQNKLR